MVVNGEVITPSDPRFYGALFDGATDDTAAWNAALAALYARGGGTLYCPIGTSRINGQIIIPNDAASQPKMPSMRITGQGASAQPVAQVGTGVVRGGTVLDMRYSSTGAKIQSFGLGQLEIDHLTIKDGGSDTTTFIFITNTVLKLHHCSFFGTGAGQDVLLCGGTTTSIDGTASAPFQGYGTVVDSCFADKIARFVYIRVYGNAIQVVNNTIWNGCAGTAPIELDGGVATCEGNFFSGNLLELIGYSYGIKLNKAYRNAFVGNGFWDQTGGFTSYFNCTDSGGNIILPGEFSDAVAMFSGNTGNLFANTLLSGYNGAGVGQRIGPIQSGGGSPESSVTGTPGELYIDTTNGNLYVKHTGTGSTGWKLVTIAA